MKESENGDAGTRAHVGSLSISETDQLHSFLNALETAVDDGRDLQLITDSPLFHIGALARIWKADRGQFQVFSTRNAAVWDDLIDKLAGVMEDDGGLVEHTTEVPDLRKRRTTTVRWLWYGVLTKSPGRVESTAGVPTIAHG